MELGKVSESVLKRSVLKYVKLNNKAVGDHSPLISGAGVGNDCSICLASGKIGTATAAATGRHRMVVVEAIINACNNLVCGGVDVYGVEISLVLPEEIYESEIRHMMEEANTYTTREGITILGGNTMVSKHVKETVVTVTAIGQYVEKEILPVEAGMDIVMSKWIGLKGTSVIATKYQSELEKRLPSRFVAEAAGFHQYMSILSEAKIAREQGVSVMHDISGGGIFRALWELAEKTEKGLRVELKKIPVKQETIEVCEVFGLNPYELLSSGALLMAAKDGATLVNILAKEGIEAMVIGKLTDSNDRVIVTQGDDGEELRYLDRPRTDEIDKM